MQSSSTSLNIVNIVANDYHFGFNRHYFSYNCDFLLLTDFLFFCLVLLLSKNITN